MGEVNKVIDKEALKNFEPLNTLSADILHQLATTARVERVSAGSAITKECEIGGRTLYLFSGMLVLANGTTILDTIRAGTTQARNPLPPFATRRATLYAKTTATLFSLDGKLLDIVLNESANKGKAGESEGEFDNQAWIANFLQSNALLQLPDTTLQLLYTRLREVPTRAGEIVIRQGSIANSYYIIRNGRCSVVHAPSLEGPQIKIAELRTGEGFGEEALITNRTRNASVIMQEPGSLMRLEKQDFMSLLVNPLLHFVSSEQTHALLASGAEIIDVRIPGKHLERDLVKHHIPLAELRAHLSKLDKNTHYVVVCSDGSQSAVAAFLLNRHGFKTHVLQGGLKKFQLRPLVNLGTNIGAIGMQEVARAPIVETIEILAPSLAPSMGGDIIDFPRPKNSSKSGNPTAAPKNRTGSNSNIELPLLTDVVMPGARKHRRASALEMAPAAQFYTQADLDAAKQQTIEEAKRTRVAELALQLAQAKANELKIKAAAIVKLAEQEARKAASDLAKKMTEEQLRTRSEFTAIANEAKDEAKKEGRRAQTAEEAWKSAEAEITRLKANLDELKRRDAEAAAKKALEVTAQPIVVTAVAAPAAPKDPEATHAAKKSIQGAKPVPPKKPAFIVGQTPKAAPADIKLGWISDSYLWETVLGYRVDPAIDSLLGPKTTPHKPQARNTAPAAPAAPEAPAPAPPKPITLEPTAEVYDPVAAKIKSSNNPARKPVLNYQKPKGAAEPRKTSARKYEILLILTVILTATLVGGGDRVNSLFQWTHQTLGISQITTSASNWFNDITGNSTEEADPEAAPEQPEPAKKAPAKRQVKQRQ